MQKQALILISLLFIVQSQYITYDENDIIMDQDIEPTLQCYDGRKITRTQTFSGLFERIPQIIFQVMRYDQDPNNNESTFQITEISTQGFKTELYCSKNQVWTFNVKWRAIDDSRIEVITVIDDTTFGQKIINHQNSIALKGHISLLSFSYSSYINFGLTLDEITYTTVKYTINNVRGLVKLSYQIILAIEEGYQYLGKIMRENPYTSDVKTKLPNSWLIIAYLGFNNSQNVYIRISTQYTLTSTTIQYKIFQKQYEFVSNEHQAIWLMYQFIQDSQPMEVKQIIATQYFDFIEHLPFNKVKIVQLEKQFSNFGTNQVIVDKTINLLNFEIINICNKGKKYVSNFYTCNSCSFATKFKKVTKACSGEMAVLVFRIRLQISTVGFKELSIVQSQNGVQVKQVLYNQKKTEVTLIDLQEQEQ